MAAEVRIVGQGLAGSLLGWAFERAGIPFTIEDRVAPSGVDNLPAVSASSVGAGIINPITGQRLVKSWRVDALLPAAVAMYQELESGLGGRFLFRYRLRRFFADERERGVARDKWARGDFGGFVQDCDEEGLWIEPAYRVDLDALVRALRRRWHASGHWRESPKPTVTRSSNEPNCLTVRCLGAAELAETDFNWSGLSPAKGELLEIENPASSMDLNVISNCHEWLVPISETRALVGATFEPGENSNETTDRAREILSHAAAQLLGEVNFKIVSQRAGVRVVAPDKHPVIGRHPEKLSLGIFNALGSKGALLAPWLSRQWCAHLVSGQPIDPAVDVSRFWR